MQGLLKKRKNVSHKGDYGRVAIIGGSLGMSGSITLASRAAFRLGCGYVYTVIPKSLLNIMSIKLNESILLSIEDDSKGYFVKDYINDIVSKLDNFDSIAFGMGIGDKEDNIEILKEILDNYNKPIIIDAQGIVLLKKINKDLIKASNIIITPHPGEMAKLLGIEIKEVQANREGWAKKVAKDLNLVVVLKGHKTVVTNGDDIYINDTGNAGMATAGSGDVLSGMIASLLAQNLNSYNAAKLSVYLHGLAGDIAKEKFGEESLIASDIVDNIYKAIKMYKAK